MVETRVFHLEDGRDVTAPAKCCLFCEHCTDVWYDYVGIWGLTCAIDGDCDAGAQGNCKDWEVDNAEL